MRIWPLATCKSGSRLFHFQAHHVRKAPFATKKHGAIPISLGVRKDGSCADTFMVTFWPCSVVMRNKWRSRSPSHQDTLSLRIALQGESSAIFLKEKRNPQKYKGLPKVSFTEKYGVFSGRGDRFPTAPHLATASFALDYYIYIILYIHPLRQWHLFSFSSIRIVFRIALCLSILVTSKRVSKRWASSAINLSGSHGPKP